MEPQSQQDYSEMHLVYSAISLTNNQLMIFIHVDCDAIEKHICNAYWPDRSAGKLNELKATESSIFKVEELGWFDDYTEFTDVLGRVPLP